MTEVDVRSDPGGPSAADAGGGGALLGLRLPLTVEVGSAEMTLREILELKASAVLSLGVTDGAPVKLLVNGVHVAEGELLSDGERLTFRVGSVESSGLDAGTLRAGPGAKPAGGAS
jgi:flagellar motor switch protein FliN